MTELNGIVLSRLPVLRLAPLKEEHGNCPFLTGNHCAIHDAEPLVCALYPLAQEITKDGQVSYFLQPTQCGGQVIAARVGDYLTRYDVPAREATDVRWAQVCMELEEPPQAVRAAAAPQTAAADRNERREILRMILLPQFYFRGNRTPHESQYSSGLSHRATALHS